MKTIWFWVMPSAGLAGCGDSCADGAGPSSARFPGECGSSAVSLAASGASGLGSPVSLGGRPNSALSSVGERPFV